MFDDLLVEGSNAAKIQVSQARLVLHSLENVVASSKLYLILSFHLIN